MVQSQSQSQIEVKVKICIEDVGMGSKAEDDDGHGQKQTPTVTVHMNITDRRPSYTYADKGYSSRASIRVRSLLSSAFLHVPSRVFVFTTYFLRFTTLFVALSFVCSSHSSPHIRFPTHLHFIFLRHNLHCDSYHTIIVQADIESSFSYAFSFLFPVLQILLIMIPLI